MSALEKHWNSNLRQRKADPQDTDEKRPAETDKQAEKRRRRREFQIKHGFWEGRGCFCCTPNRCRGFLLTGMFFLPGVWAIYTQQVTLALLGVTSADGLRWWLQRILSFWFLSMIMANHMQAMFRNPGYVEQEQCKPDDESGRYKVDAPVGEGRFELPEPIYFSARWCDTCMLWKPPRSHHCNTCDRCVLRWDHWCPISQNSIGFNNHGNFLLLYLFGWCALVYSSYEAWGCLKAHNTWSQLMSDGKRLGTWEFLKFAGPHLSSRGLLVTTVQFIFNCIYLMPVSWLGGCQWKRNSKNQIMIEVVVDEPPEKLVLPRNTETKLSKTFYDRGFFSNMYTILGPKWYLRMTMPIPVSPNYDIKQGYYPKPGKSEIRRLKLESQKILKS